MLRIKMYNLYLPFGIRTYKFYPSNAFLFNSMSKPSTGSNVNLQLNSIRASNKQLCLLLTLCRTKRQYLDEIVNTLTESQVQLIDFDYQRVHARYQYL